MLAAVQLEEHTSEQARIVKEVFGVMADIVADPATDPWPPSEELVTAAIYFTEPSKGAMTLECVLPQAFEFTSRLMSVPRPTTVDANVCDSLSELVNMIAGNFKALMPPETGFLFPRWCASGTTSCECAEAKPSARSSLRLSLVLAV